jgi:hypothetical protein
MKLNQGIVRALCGALLFSSSLVAHAHYLWLESNEGGGGTKLYYGEAEAGLKEKSPGKLDSIGAPKAYVESAASGAPVAGAIDRKADHFAIAVSGPMRAVLVSEESSDVRDLTKYGLGIAKTNYYARLGQASGGSASPLALDVVERSPNTLAVLYRGQPLKHAKLEVIAPNTWMQEHKTDEHGVVKINTPWRGRYVVHVLHLDGTPGEYAGKKYENLRNHFTYTFSRTDGADPGPAVPPRHAED